LRAVYSGFSQAGAGGPAAVPAGAVGFDDRRSCEERRSPAHTVSVSSEYPGWYRGRAVHIHMKVHVGGSVVHTGQLFFDDDLTDKVYGSGPYSSRGTPDVRNSADDIYRSAGAASAILAVTPSGQGYAGEITVGVEAHLTRRSAVRLVLRDSDCAARRPGC
jgi:hypothetical protein